MGFFDRYTESGLSGTLGHSPKANFIHQIIISNLVNGIYATLPKGYIAMAETQLDPNNTNSKVPDVVVFKTHKNDVYKYRPILFIEIEKSNMVKKNLAKSIEMMRKYNILESFVYDYEQKKWYKLFDKDNIINPPNNDSYSNILNLDLNTFV